MILSKDLNLPIGLRVGGRGVVIPDSQLWAKIPEWLVVKLLSIVRDQDTRDSVLADNFSPDEVSYIFLRDGG